MRLLAAVLSATVCISAEDREAIRGIMLDGIDSALKQHTMHLFDTLIKDRGEQPDRMVRGMQGGIQLYIRSRSAINKWSPPKC